MPKNINLRRNADYEVTCRWLDAEGEPVPLSNAAMQVRLEDGTFLASASAVLHGDPDHWVTLTIVQEDIASIPEEVRVAKYDLILVRLADGAKHPAEWGDAIIDTGVTQNA